MLSGCLWINAVSLILIDRGRESIVLLNNILQEGDKDNADPVTVHGEDPNTDNYFLPPSEATPKV